MKPFDKEAFMNGAIALTRRQVEVRYFGELPHTEKPHVAAVKFELGEGHFEERIVQFDEDFHYISGCAHPLDLVAMKPVKKTYYTAVSEHINAYPVGTRGLTYAFPDKQELIDAGYPEHRIFSIEVEE